MNDDLTGPSDPRVIGAFIGLFIAMMAGLYVMFELFGGSNRTSPIQTLATNCEAAGGVMIQGVTQHGDTHENFAICVPYEALTCIDVE